MAQYAVQIGAYAKPQLADRSKATGIAEVYDQPTGLGFTKILAGHYTSEADAQTALNALKAAGYRDAFVTRAENRRRAPRITTTASNATPRMRWNHLDASLREKLVILDGQPHIKEGKTFTPLAQYVSQ